MARKKKGHKELPNTSQQNEQTTTTTTPTSNNNLNSQKRASYEDLLQKTTEAAEQKFQQYQSDSELMALKQKLNLEKNKSNLFLIKSYSFIDKTNNKKPLKLKKQNTIESRDLHETQEQLDCKKKLKSKSNKLKSKLEDKDEKLEKPKKPPKLKKIKKSKSTDDSTDNLQDLQDLLRKPSIIKEGEEHVSNRNALRPQSLPVAKNEHKIVGKAKTLDDLETPRLKRDSFLRHSLQSIRRSFSTSKKHSHHISITSSSSSSASSNSSGVLDLPRKSKWKCNNKDIANLNDVEESNYSMSLQDVRKPCQIVITVSDKESQQNNAHVNNCSYCTQTLKSTNSSPPPTRSPYSTMDPLTVLKEEEDEKDGNVESCTGRFTTCINAPERSTSSVSTLAQLAPDSLLPMAPLQTHTECQSVQCLNTLDKDYQNSSASLTSNNNNNNNNNTSSSSPPQQKQKREGSSTQLQHQLSIPESLQSTSIGCATSSEYTSARSLKHSATSLTPLPSLNSSGSLRSISPSRRSASSNSSSTAKHEQQSTAAAATAAAAAAAAAASAHTLTTSGSNGSSSSSSANAGTTNAAGSTAATTTPPEKEKKRKEISSSRVKKFHRHFAQVSKDEKLINYFSCALVSDILLQGHLYITDQHFAFYSNVFGYVTKVVIPTSSVTKISKEKTAKIIPNAVGVATADERHVFGSFISREAAFRLMCSVCPPLGAPEILPKDPASIEISEEYSIEDDSSCSISGNESPAQITELQNGNTLAPGDTNATGQTILRRSVGSSNLSLADIRHSDIPKTNAKSTATNSQQAASSTRASAPPVPGSHYTNGKGLGSGGVSGAGGANVNLLGLKNVLQQPALTNDNAENANMLTIIAGCASSTTSATSTPTPSSSSSPTTVMTPGMSSPITNGSGGTGAITKVKQRVTNIFSSVNKKLSSLHLKFPTEIHVVYLGVMLTLLLSLFSIFLLYRILDIEAKTNYYRSPVEFNWRSGNDDDIFSEALRFQKQLQLKSTEEAQHILKTNLEQIAKVRRSLETLSMLIHDRSSSFVSTHTDDSD